MTPVPITWNFDKNQPIGSLEVSREIESLIVFNLARLAPTFAKQPDGTLELIEVSIVPAEPGKAKLEIMKM